MEGQKNNLSMSVAVVIAGLLIAGAIIFTNGNSSDSNKPVDYKLLTIQTVANATPSVSNVRPISPEDRIKGNPNAPVKIIEYSDLECPFCIRAHQTHQQILAQYGDQVAVVFRHFPLPQLHEKATTESHAAECVAEQKGNEGFWKVVDGVFATTKGNDSLEFSDLRKIVLDTGVKEKDFNECMESGKFVSKIQADAQNSIDSGGSGTPFHVLVREGKDPIVLPGAYPLTDARNTPEIDSFKEAIDSLLK